MSRGPEPTTGNAATAAELPSTEQARSAQQVLRSVLSLLFLRGGGTILGIGIATLTAARFGAGMAADAFLLTFRVTTGFSQPFGQVVKIVSIPTVVEGLMLGDPKQLIKTWLRPAAGLAAIFVAVSLVIAVRPNLVLMFVAPGFEGEQLILARRLLRVQGLLIPTTYILSLVLTVSNATRRYLIAGLYEELPRLLIVATLLFFVPPLGVIALPWALLTGTLLAIVMLSLRARVILAEKSALEPRELAPMKFWHKLTPLVLWQFHTILLNSIDMAFASTIGVGNIAVLAYGSRLMRILPALVTNSILYVLFVEVSHRALRSSREKMQGSLVKFVRVSMFVLMPTATGLAMLSRPLVELILKRGAFSAQDAIITADFMALLAPAVVVGFLIRTFLFELNLEHDLPRIRLVVIPIVLGIVVRVILDFLFVPWLGILGIATSVSISTLLQVVCILVMLSRAWEELFQKDQAVWLLKLGLASAVSGLAMLLIRDLPRMTSVHPTVGLLVVLLVTSAAGAISFTAMSLLLRIEETQRIIRLLKGHDE